MQSKMTYYLKLSVNNRRFVLCIVVLFILMFTTIVYIDPNTSKGYSVIEAMMSLQVIESENITDLSFVNVFKYALHGNITLIMPLLVAFPCVSVLADERKSKMTYFSCSRMELKLCWMSQFIACIITAFCVIVCAYGLFGMVTGAIFPTVVSGEAGVDPADAFASGSIKDTIIPCLLTSGLYGALVSLPVLICYSFMKNEYMYYSISLVFIYLFEGTTDLFQKRWGEFLPEGMDFYCFRPESILNFTHLKENGKRVVVAVYLIGTILSLIVYMLFKSRRYDYGD